MTPEQLLRIRRAAEDAINAANPRFAPFIDAVADPLAIIALCDRAALSAPAQPASGEAVALGLPIHNLRTIANGLRVVEVVNKRFVAARLDEISDHLRDLESATPPASQEQANNLCFELSTHLGCAPSNADVIAAVSSLIDARQTASQEQADPWKTEAMGKMSRIEESMTLLADKLEQASQEQAQPAQCDGGTCRLGGYCDKCPKQAQPSGEVVAWRDPSNSNPAQGCTYDKATHDKWPHIYRQALYTAPQPAQPAARVAMTEADRYALLRDGTGWPAVFDSAGAPEPLRGTVLDAAIDAARGITSNGATDAGVAE